MREAKIKSQENKTVGEIEFTCNRCKNLQRYKNR